MSQKTIQLNPEFMSSTKNRRVRTRNKKEKIRNSRVPNNTNSLRKQLLKKIKDYQKNTEENLNKTPKGNGSDTQSNDFSNEFNKSLDFLQNLSAARRKKSLKKDRNKPTGAPATNPLVGTSVSEGDQPPVEVNIATELPISMFEHSNLSLPQTRTTQKIHAMTPPYSSMKNGTRPTYRDWKRLTQKSPSVMTGEMSDAATISGGTPSTTPDNPEHSPRRIEHHHRSAGNAAMARHGGGKVAPRYVGGGTDLGAPVSTEGSNFFPGS